MCDPDKTVRILVRFSHYSIKICSPCPVNVDQIYWLNCIRFVFFAIIWFYLYLLVEKLSILHLEMLGWRVRYVEDEDLFRDVSLETKMCRRDFSISVGELIKYFRKKTIGRRWWIILEAKGGRQNKK